MGKILVKWYASCIIYMLFIIFPNMPGYHLKQNPWNVRITLFRTILTSGAHYVDRHKNRC